ncbi:protein adenylyltransferase SelO [Acetobacter persici]|uniref:protein adenylyltransferase SelO n=1 Tax=Acetobacter persici TaxID=1076596 RepID=UPI0039E94D95
MTSFFLRQTYGQLPEPFHASVALTPVAAPRLVKLNVPLAQSLGLDAGWLAGPEGVAMLSGSAMPEGVHPLALAYAGHQFGQFVPRLGDGRALLLGDVTDSSGQVREIQLKGSGRTAYSRRGDGRAALGPVLREYVVSEAMAALGVPTTRALAAVVTGEQVMRETPLPGAVITRVASSHIRVGTFQFFAARQDRAGLRTLADYAIARHYPDAAHAPAPYLALLERVIAAQADLVAQWMLKGFIHGVMNTDNMAVSGETIDYGPCAFMEQYDPTTVFSFIDERGRYAYGNQPSMALWNLTRLAEALLPLLAEDEEQAVPVAQQALATFEPRFQATYLAGLRAKLGLKTDRPDDTALFRSLLETMQEAQADFTQTFRALSSEGAVSGEGVPELLSAFGPWLARWRQRLAQEEAQPASDRAAAMQCVNPAYIPRNHLVEAMIKAAVEDEDFSRFEALLAVCTRPYEDQPGMEAYARPAQAAERVRYTFCGT